MNAAAAGSIEVFDGHVEMKWESTRRIGQLRQTLGRYYFGRFFDENAQERDAMVNTMQSGGASGKVADLIGTPAESFKMSDYGPDRRRHERKNVRYRAEARRMDNTLEAQRSPRFALVVLDVSEGGIRATSRVPIVDGERLAIFLPPEAAMPKQIFGKVVRCSARRDGWALAIKFDYIPAA